MLQAGATDIDIVREVGISDQELQRIFNEHPELQLIRKTKYDADQQVEEGLLKRAMGYDVEETEVVASKDGKPIKVKRTKRHVPASIEACKLLMRFRNRR